MNTYSVTVKPNRRRSRVVVWTRFASSQADALASAEKAVNETYFGSGVVVSVALVGQGHVSN